MLQASPRLEASLCELGATLSATTPQDDPTSWHGFTFSRLRRKKYIFLTRIRLRQGYAATSFHGFKWVKSTLDSCCFRWVHLELYDRWVNLERLDYIRTAFSDFLWPSEMSLPHNPTLIPLKYSSWFCWSLPGLRDVYQIIILSLFTCMTLGTSFTF